MATKKRSLVSGLRPEVHRLPLNRLLGAHNVYEIPVDASLIEAAREIYHQHIAPRVSDQHGSFHSGDFAFHVNRPPDWGSDISWWSADDAQTYRYFESEFFLKVNLGEPLDRLIDIDNTVRLYCPLFVVRSRCERTFFHVDYEPGCGTNAYTLMTPLEDMSSMGDGHLAYLDARGRPRIYRYKKVRQSFSVRVFFMERRSSQADSHGRFFVLPLDRTRRSTGQKSGKVSTNRAVCYAHLAAHC